MKWPRHHPLDTIPNGRTVNEMASSVDLASPQGSSSSMYRLLPLELLLSISNTI